MKAYGAPKVSRKGMLDMSLLKCPKCGEMFSDSYKECPFCLEDEDFYNGRKAKNPGRRVEKPKAPSILGPAMVLVVLLLVGYLGYAFLGGTVASWFDREDDQPGIDQPVGDDESKDDENQDGENQGDSQQTLAAITLDKSSLAMELKETAQLSASGAEAITWSSSDTAVATVDETGKVTAVSVGNATITATAEGATSAACVVTVVAPKKDLVLQSIYGTRDDISISVSGGAPMEVLGTDSTIQWSTEDSSIATVDSDGYVKGVGRGKTKVIAKVDGQTLTCIVRVG